jgi:hypothetical protein
MSSFIHYKFKSAKDYDTYRFDGAGVPVWELKQEIIQAKKLDKGLDFDLVISNAQTNEGSPSPPTSSRDCSPFVMFLDSKIC